MVVASGLPARTAATQPWHLPANLSLIQSPPSRLRLRKLSPCLPAGPATKVLTFNGQRHTAAHSRPVVCNSTGSGSSQEQHQASSQSSSSNGPKQPKQPKPWRWWSQLAQNLRNQQPLKLLLNVAFAFFLLRLWPMGSRNGFNDSDSLVVPVPFSEFVRRVKENDVRTVTMEGLTINYALRTTSPLLANPPQGVDATKLTFSTIRPADYAVPYDLLEKHNVMFSAVAKSGTNFSTLLVYALYAGLLLSAFGKMPLRLPSKGAGRRHKGGEDSSITFDDVAGVDEAKEELAEIVVGACCRVQGAWQGAWQGTSWVAWAVVAWAVVLAGLAAACQGVMQRGGAVHSRRMHCSEPCCMMHAEHHVQPAQHNTMRPGPVSHMRHTRRHPPTSSHPPTLIPPLTLPTP
jgi:hypothetical protein